MVRVGIVTMAISRNGSAKGRYTGYLVGDGVR